MNQATAKRLRLLGSALTVLIFISVVAALWGYSRLRASLPTLDGNVKVVGLKAPVTVQRDALGVPTITGQSRVDVSRALGFLHAQDRFFQMDLSRRRAAGELSSLVGKAAVPVDHAARVHEFRRLAKVVLERLPASQRSLVDAYTDGVNTGLRQLHAKPFEYTILRAEPVSWKPEDTILIIYAMTLDLQDSDNNYEQSLLALRDTLGNAALNFFAPLTAADDAALDGSVGPAPTIPSERHLDLRKRNYANLSRERRWLSPEELSPGSNSLAVTGAHSATGSAVLANDMHLNLRVPNTWYRASLIYPAPSVTGKQLRVTGVTLPGAPVIVAGSNGHIAWGFTNAYIDVSDLVLIDVSTVDPNVYGTAGKLLQMENHRDTIEVKGEAAVPIETKWTLWGPIVGTAAKRPLAMKWTMHDPDAANFKLAELETAADAHAAVKIAHAAGVPVQNFVVADEKGEIAWTICGKIPRRVGLDGRLPISWSFGDRRWDGFLADDEVPTLYSPDGGRIWTANQRIVGGEALRLLGDGGYSRAPRAGRIRELVGKLEHAGTGDLLAIQLDDFSTVLGYWHDLLLKVLSDDAASQKSSRAELRKALQTWTGRAEVDSVSYRLVKSFRAHVIQRLLAPIFDPCVQAYPDFNFKAFHYEAALRKMIEEQPPNLLDLTYTTWNDALLLAADDVLLELDKNNVPLSRATWGAANVAAIRHPLSRFIPLLGSSLDMAREALAGDVDMPRVQGPSFGASERFVVSPGHEEQALFHMPGGQSGHPLSPFYRAGHEAWVKGEPTPFLPGPAQHQLVLQP